MKPDESTSPYIECINGTFTWGFHFKQADKDKPADSVLTGINFKVQPGEIVAVVGKVGSGKTSLIASILKETFIQEG